MAIPGLQIQLTIHVINKTKIPATILINKQTIEES